MLNYNKIHSCINFDRTSKTKLADYVSVSKSTFIHRLNNENLAPNDVFGIANYFKKPIGYFFDEEEKQPDNYEKKQQMDQANDKPTSPYTSPCTNPECIKKISELEKDKATLREFNNFLKLKLEEGVSPGKHVKGDVEEPLSETG